MQKQNYNYSDCSFLIAGMKPDGKVVYVGGGMKRDKENWIDCQIEAGDYIVLIRTPWLSFVDECSFSIYGPKMTKIKQITEKDVPKNMIQEMFYQFALQKKHEWDNFAQYGQPNIKLAFFNNNGGYAYLLFKNETTSVQMQGTVEFLGSENIKIMEPYSGLRPTVFVNPGESVLLPIIATKIPYKIWYRILSSFKDTEFKKNIKEKVRQSTIQVQKQYNGQKVDIKSYFLYHQEGFAILYVNQTKNLVMKEELEFDLKNCYIDGVYGNYIHVTIEPQQEQLVQILKNDNATSFEANISKLFYKVTEK